MAKEDKPQLVRRRLVGKRPIVKEDTSEETHRSRDALMALGWEETHRPRDALMKVVEHGKDLFTEQEKFKLLQVHRAVGCKWDDVLRARLAIEGMRKLVFSRYLGELFDEYGVSERSKYDMAGSMMQFIRTTLDHEKVRLRPRSDMLSNKKAVAVALCRAVMSTDYASCPAREDFLEFLMRTVGSDVWVESARVEQGLLQWL